jgi:hypothetical protein
MGVQNVEKARLALDSFQQLCHISSNSPSPRLGSMLSTLWCPSSTTQLDPEQVLVEITDSPGQVQVSGNSVVVDLVLEIQCI